MLSIWKVRPINWLSVSKIQLRPQPQGRAPQQPAPVNKKINSTKVDCSRLGRFLSAGQLWEADDETYQLMLQAVDRQGPGWLRASDVETFPCHILQEIDQLWLQHSNFRFGFSQQQRIWEAVEYDYQRFGEQVGWKVADGWAAYVNRGWLPYEEMTFNYTAPPGHLPSSWTQQCELPTCLGGCGYLSLEDVFDRLTTCEFCTD
jgi:hypothetical protein